jgi:hypothetical protein
LRWATALLEQVVRCPFLLARPQMPTGTAAACLCLQAPEAALVAICSWPRVLAAKPAVVQFKCAAAQVHWRLRVAPCP